jgi:phytoene desaturase
MSVKAAVIGSGIGGIAVALRLAARGYEVCVYEKNEHPGGKLSEIRHEGFRFDTGPSLFTLPQLIVELFELAGEKAADHFNYSKLEEICRYFYEDGMIIRAFSNAESFAGELQKKAGEDPVKVKAYLDKSRKIYEITNPVFIGNSLHLFRNFVSRDFFRSLFQVHKLKSFTTLHQVNSKYFKHRNTVQLFDRFATYNGSDPYKTPATLMVIPHLEHNTGAFFPASGMFDITKSLVALAGRMGVSFFYSNPVEEILTEGNQVIGIRVNRQDLKDFNIIVSDLDIWYLYKDLLKSRPFPKKWFRHERSTSALIFYWGMKTVSPGLDLHNILFSNDYQREFDCLFHLKTIYADPTVYIFISSKMTGADAPAGCENWFVMINTPENVGQDWDEMIAEAKSRIEEKIVRITGIHVGQHRLFEYVLDPRDIESKTASYRGSLYGNSSNSVWAAFQRHPNFSGIKGLYFTGGSVHPGGGIPLCLSSAKIVADMIPSLKK